MRRPRVLLLDLDGPILDVRERYFAAHQRAASKLAATRALTAEELWDAKRQQQPVAEILGMPPDEGAIAHYQQRWREVIELDELLMLDVLQADALPALERLRVIPERVLVSLRSNETGVRATINRLRLTEYFTRIEIVSHAVGSKLTCFRTYGTPETPDTTTVIGDTEIDIDAARQLGFSVIAVSCGIRTAAFLSNRGAVVVPDLKAAADRILG